MGGRRRDLSGLQGRGRPLWAETRCGEPTRALGDSPGRQATGEDAQSTLIIAPEGAAAPARKPSRDDTLIKALVRAHRWRRMLDHGLYTLDSEIGDAENISKSYVSRILRLALLAPDIIETILEGRSDLAPMAGAARAAAAGGLGGAALALGSDMRVGLSEMRPGRRLPRARSGARPHSNSSERQDHQSERGGSGQPTHD